MKTTTNPRHPLVYVYAVIASLIGVTSFLGEAFAAPVPQNLLALTWIPLLIALWGWVLNVKIGQQKFWKVTAFSVLILDFLFDFIVPFFTQTSDEQMLNALSLPLIGVMIILAIIYSLFILSLYVVIFLYAITGWDKLAKKSTATSAKTKKPASKK